MGLLRACISLQANLAILTEAADTEMGYDMTERAAKADYEEAALDRSLYN